MNMRGTVVLLLLASLLATAPQGAEAQRQTYTKGQPVYPAYEGWQRDADGSVYMMFGYMNQNWEQALNIPVGPDNHFSPVQADQGQPTHLLPRRNRFVFRVPVPADFDEDGEIIWTLRANGEVNHAYGTLREDLFVDNIVVMSETGALGAGSSTPEIRANIPPKIQVEGPLELTARVGEVLTLAAVVTDDGQPSRRPRTAPADSAAADTTAAAEPAAPDPRTLLTQALRAGTASATVSKRVRLHFTWFIYRGPGEVAEFDPPQVKPWEDTRPFANSPWASQWKSPEIPEDGRWVSEVKFSQPGTYVIRGRADDGGLYSDVEVTVRVSPAVS
jgi:hypothetical protein